MPKGGARARSGPPPDPQALKRDRDGSEWLELPAGGRDGDVPDWPLPNETQREGELWEREWKRPQAIVWDRNGQVVEVAMYVRNLTAAESHQATTSTRTLLKQQMDTLGLTVPGMRANRWRIVDEVTSRTTTAPGSSRPSARDRLKVVEGGKTA